MHYNCVYFFGCSNKYKSCNNNLTRRKQSIMPRNRRLCIDIGFCYNHFSHPVAIPYRRRTFQFHSTISEMSWLQLNIQPQNWRFQSTRLRNWKVLDYVFCFRLHHTDKNKRKKTCAASCTLKWNIKYRISLILHTVHGFEKLRNGEKYIATYLKWKKILSRYTSANIHIFCGKSNVSKLLYMKMK